VDVDIAGLQAAPGTVGLVRAAARQLAAADAPIPVERR
jgi:hypothetical protein